MERHSRNHMQDPVCGRKLDLDAKPFSAVFDAHTFHFCSQGCLDRFNQDRVRFARTKHSGFKGVWARYLTRVRKATDGKPPCCH